jgi:hypothetical protein
MEKLIVRLLLIPLTAAFLYQALSIVERFLTNLIYFCARTIEGFPFRLHPVSFILLVFFIFWLAAQLVLEILAHFKQDINLSYWLRHLRYAPIAALILAQFIVVFFDAGMIEFSKLRIENYVYNNSAVIAKPDFALHNDYRGWCGNGYPARKSDLYFDTAAEGLKDESPQVRARALLMTGKVADLFLNGTDTKRFNEKLKTSCLDADSTVRNTAQSVLHDRGTDCEQISLIINK